ncbi:hypothetical protein AOLI_G00023210 [Acnodon oligacanthus]
MFSSELLQLLEPSLWLKDGNFSRRKALALLSPHKRPQDPRRTRLRRDPAPCLRMEERCTESVSAVVKLRRLSRDLSSLSRRPGAELSRAGQGRAGVDALLVQRCSHTAPFSSLHATAPRGYRSCWGSQKQDRLIVDRLVLPSANACRHSQLCSLCFVPLWMRRAGLLVPLPEGLFMSGSEE